MRFLRCKASITKTASKGPVTIAQALRQHAGLHPHSDVEFEVQANGDKLLCPVAWPAARDAALLAGQTIKSFWQEMDAKTWPMPDFHIGAHALARGLPLLTRDAAR